MPTEEDKLNSLKDYSKSFKLDMFASRDSGAEAIKYAYDLIESLPKEYRISAFTALHVTLNSISNDIQTIINE
jgi:hypothetical protein